MIDLQHFADIHPGRVHVLGPFSAPDLETPRHVRVYVPNLFGRGPRRVLYLFDGQNVFDDEPSFAGGWHAHEAVERVARSGHPVPAVVGIDHGGSRRIDELSPFRVARGEGQLEVLLEWMIRSVMPAIGRVLELEPGPLAAAIGGSSMGGLAALYAHFRYPDVFGGALGMSPSFWVGGERMFDFVASVQRPAVSRIYIDCGAREGRMFDLSARMARLLCSRGYSNEQFMWRPDKRGAHNERHWRRRLPAALRFMYG